MTAPFQAATIFQTPAYLMNYRRVFGANREFHRVRTKGANAFLSTRGKSARRLEWWGAGIHDVGSAAYNSPGSARALWDKIEALAHDCDGAHLAQIAGDSLLIECAHHAGWRVQEAEACPVLSLPPTWDEYVSSLGKNMREQIKRYPKRLEREFRVEAHLAQTPAEVESALDNLFELHGKRWRARGQTGVLATPRRRRFHRALCASLLKRDRLRLWSLSCDDKPACVLLSYVYDGRYSFFIGGFEPELMRWSVGTCLFARVLRHAIEEGAHEFDFLRGEEEYKYRFGAVNLQYQTVSWFAPTGRGKLLNKRINWEAAVLKKLHEKFSASHRNNSVAADKKASE